MTALVFLRCDTCREPSGYVPDDELHVLTETGWTYNPDTNQARCPKDASK